MTLDDPERLDQPPTRRDLLELRDQLRAEIRAGDEETRRHSKVLYEDLRVEIQFIAEGHTTLVAGLQRIDDRMTEMHHDLSSTIQLVFREIDGRLRRLEAARP